MSTIRPLGLAIGIVFAASSFALAQQSNPAANQQANPAANQQGNPAANQQGKPTNQAAASGTKQGKSTNHAAANGNGMHQTSQGTGSARSAANHRVVTHPATGRRLAVRTHPVTGRRLYAFQPLSGCHFVRVGNNLFRRICR